jgi:2'-5' RNA ligase
MRVFIAIDLPDQVRQNLAEIEQSLKPVTDTVRWVPPESIHITLKFIGEIPETRVADIDSAILGLSWKPFTIGVRGLGFFPGKRSPRVLWAGMEAPTMPGLAEQLDAKMELLGFEKEKRAFRPHITLARARDTRIDNGLVNAALEYEEYDFGSFTADRLFLFQSNLKPAGAIYTKLREYLLER